MDRERLTPSASNPRSNARLKILDAPRSLHEDQRKFRPDIYWYLSFRCNLACKHCSVFSSPYVDTSDDLTREQCLAVVDDMVALNVRTAILTGGEVLVRRDALEIITAIASRDIQVGLESNGTVFRLPFVLLAKKLQAENKLGITVSVDGGTAEAHDALRGPGAFRRTIDGLRLLASHGIRFDIQAILSRLNYHTIPEVFALARELKPALRTVLFGFLNPVGRGKELSESKGLTRADIESIFWRIRKESANYDGKIVLKMPPAAVPPRHLDFIHSAQARSVVTCQFPLLGILPNGDVTVCAVSRDNEDLHFGNVRTHRLKDMWMKARMDLLRSRYVAAESLTGICGDCIWQTTCKGSCRAWAYEAGGSFDAPFPICDDLYQQGQFPDAYRVSLQSHAMETGTFDPKAATNLGAGCGVGPGCG